MIYRYFGLVFGHLRRRLVLVSAQLDAAGAHASVWAGCNAPDNRSWVQGGVFLDNPAATVPSVYIEEKGPEVRDGYQLYSWPLTGFGVPVCVTISRRLLAKQWRVEVTWQEEAVPGQLVKRAKRSRWVEVPHPTIDADLELFGPATAVARIGLRTVRGTGRK